MKTPICRASVLARAASSFSISPSPPSDGGEGRGEEVRFYWFPLSSVLSPLVPRGERMGSLMQPWVLALLLAFARQRGVTQDMTLSQILIGGEDWQRVAERLAFTDAACSDAQGNFYFSDLPKGIVHRVGLDGKDTAFIENGPKISGLKFGPDGRLYACTQGPKKQIVAFALPSKEMAVLADDVQPNDLVVTHKGDVYFTETGKHQSRLPALTAPLPPLASAPPPPTP